MLPAGKTATVVFTAALLASIVVADLGVACFKKNGAPKSDTAGTKKKCQGEKRAPNRRRAGRAEVFLALCIGKAKGY
jgi:hypothetical protein